MAVPRTDPKIESSGIYLFTLHSQSLNGLGHGAEATCSAPCRILNHAHGLFHKVFIQGAAAAAPVPVLYRCICGSSVVMAGGRWTACRQDCPSWVKSSPSGRNAVGAACTAPHWLFSLCQAGVRFSSAEQMKCGIYCIGVHLSGKAGEPNSKKQWGLLQGRPRGKPSQRI